MEGANTNYDNILNDLNSKVEKMKVVPVTNDTGGFKLPFNLSVDMKSASLYAGIIVAAAAGLFYMKPSIVTNEVDNPDAGKPIPGKDDKGVEPDKIQQLSYLKLIMWTLIISVPLIIGLYVYFYRKPLLPDEI